MLIANHDFEISALKNIHPPIDNSHAFRFKLGKKTIVFSGDTAYFPSLATFSTGADYLVHEVMYIPAVDDIAKRRPNVPPDDKSLADQTWLDAVKRTFSGNIIIGKDLLQFEI